QQPSCVPALREAWPALVGGRSVRADHRRHAPPRPGLERRRDPARAPATEGDRAPCGARGGGRGLTPAAAPLGALVLAGALFLFRRLPLFRATLRVVRASANHARPLDVLAEGHVGNLAVQADRARR